jgi:hypothetical protein
MSIIALQAAVTAGRITFARGTDRHIILCQTGVAASCGHRPADVRLSATLVDLLAALGAAKRFHIMSLFRANEGPHGVLRAGGGFECRGVDISICDGLTIDLGAAALAGYGLNTSATWIAYRDSLIEKVADIISSFPAGDYGVGFPRPIGGAGGFRPDFDVFLPVRDAAMADRAFRGVAGAPLNIMLDPARDAIGAAVSQARNYNARFEAFFPDGKDHIHIKAF